MLPAIVVLQQAECNVFAPVILGAQVNVHPRGGAGATRQRRLWRTSSRSASAPRTADATITQTRRDSRVITR